METLQPARRCSMHTRAKPGLSVKALGTDCIGWKSPLPGLKMQRFAVPANRRTQFGARGLCLKVLAQSIASQVQPRVGGLPSEQSKNGASAKDKKAKGSAAHEAQSQIRALISRVSQVRDGWEGNGDLGIQPSREVKERTEGLLHRLVSLQQFAEQHSGPDGSVPVQVIATMKALSRELGSLENIVRLANDSGATVTRSKGDPSSLVPSSFPSKPPLPMVAVKERQVQPIRSQELQHEAVQNGQSENGTGFLENAESQLFTDQSVGGSDYAVSAPAGKGASPLAAFREEIERRVIEQLSSKMEQQAPKKVERRTGPAMQAGSVQAPLPQKQPWTEQDDWAWSGESILDTGLADRRKAEFDLGPSEDPRVESSFSASTSGSDTWKHQQYVKATDIVRQQKMKAMEEEIRTAEWERLKMELNRIEAELQSAESSTARMRVKELESKVRQLEIELSRSVPLSIHDEVVKKLQGTVSELRGRIRELEGFVRERESMITVVSNNLIAERDAVVKKLTAELSKRVTTDEVDRAVASAVNEVRAELSVAQKEVREFAKNLEQREEELEARMRAWEQEKTAVNGELEATIARMVAVEATMDERRAEVLREQVRAVELERELARLNEERSTLMAGAVAEKEALLQQVAVLKSTLTESERRSRLFSCPPTAQPEAENEALPAQRDGTQDTVQLERVRLELRGLMKVAEAGQVALLVKKIADLLVSISKEGGASVPPGAFAGAGLKTAETGNGVATQNGAAQKGPAQNGAASNGAALGALNGRSSREGVRFNAVTRAAGDIDEYDSDEFLSDGGYETEEEEAAPAEVAPPGDLRGTPVEPERVLSREVGQPEAEPAFPEKIELPPSKEAEPPATGEGTQTAVDDTDDSRGVSGLAAESGLGQGPETVVGEERGEAEDGPTITLYYETGWETAYVHCSVDGQSWTEPPGLQMTEASNPEGLPVKMLEFPATSLEFVLTNGTGDWDQPGHGGNYHINHAGVFTLSSGDLVPKGE